MRRLLCLVLLLLVGCGRGYGDARHLVVSTGDGRALDPADRKILDDRAQAAYLDQLLANLDQAPVGANGKRQLLVFIHGGLRRYTTSFGQSQSLRDKIEEDGYYPVFLIWPSDLNRSYFEHLFLVRQGEKRPLLAALTSPFFLLGDLATGLVRAPGNILQQLGTGVTTWGPTTTRAQSNAKARAAELMRQYEAWNGTGPAPMKVVAGEDHRGGWGKFGRFTLYLVTLPAKLVTGTLIDGLGEPAYANMNRRTETMFRRTDEYHREYNEQVTDPRFLESYGGGTGAVARFFNALEGMGKRREGIEITLVGHSMGTIVANRILRTYPELPVSRVVYMAAACTIEDFTASVVPFLRGHPETRFHNLCLNPTAEAREIQWAFLDLAPRGSLLEWIDNFLANPRTPSERTLGKWTNIILASHLIPADVRGQVVIKAFDVGNDAHPQKHGDFDEHRFWRDDFRQ